MDIFSHGLWAGIGAEAANRMRPERRINPRIAAFWGVFPDLFAFAIPFLWLLVQFLSGDAPLESIPRPENGGGFETGPRAFLLARRLYMFSHSMVIFFLVFGACWLLYRRAVWELGGWLLHILADIPTHTSRFFPTPVFWPVSNVTFSGFSWANPKFLLADYFLIALAFFLLFRKKRAP